MVELSHLVLTTDHHFVMLLRCEGTASNSRIYGESPQKCLLRKHSYKADSNIYYKITLFCFCLLKEVVTADTAKSMLFNSRNTLFIVCSIGQGEKGESGESEGIIVLSFPTFSLSLRRHQIEV